MKYIKKYLMKYALLTTILLVFIGVGVSRLPTLLLADLLADANSQWMGTLGRLLASFMFISLLYKLDWAKLAGISQAYKSWHKHWFIIVSPMLIIALANLTGVNWGALQFSLSSLITLVIENGAVGLFEESMMRGFAFYVLYRAWNKQAFGIFKAAIAQALIFGLMHLVNLHDRFVVDVIAQVVYATLLGIGFAGIVAYTRTIWTAVFAHSFINMIGSINAVFNPNYIDIANTTSNYILMIIVIFTLVTLPGLWCLNKAKVNHIVEVSA